MKRLPELSEMEHITSAEFGENMDAILDRIIEEDIAMVIDHNGKSYVICPAHWFDIPDTRHIETLLKYAIRYVATADDADRKETVEMVCEFLPVLSSECIETLLSEMIQSTKGEPWTELKSALENELSTIKKEE